MRDLVFWRTLVRASCTLVLAVAVVASTSAAPPRSANAGTYNPDRAIGDAVPAWSGLPGVDGKEHGWDEVANRDFVVVVFTCNSCPYAVDYEQRINALATKHAGPESRVAVVAINANTIPEDSLAAMTKRAEAEGFVFSYLFDASQEVPKSFGALRTPEVFLLNTQRQILYMGAIDDNTDAAKVGVRYLEDALEAALSGREITVAETPPVGCLIRFKRQRRPPARSSGAITTPAPLEVTALEVPPLDVPVLEVTGDIRLDPQKTYGPIVVKASGVVIDGQGAWLVGPAADAESPADFRGTAILAEGVSNVTLRNVKARGWETGLVVRDGTGWRIEGCDFSDNFHDPAFGWGENGRRGGILLERVSGSTLQNNRANRVWDACVLVDADDNLLEDNDFSHTSNTCLKLWTSCRNTVRGNTLTHGIRIDPGEVHARDSTCVLIESGSNDNRFLDNDCTHGGDGIFVRVLNGWSSTGNHFEGNDCSHANNNGVECWAPGNTFIGNTANHCSYGFWLGGSDRTRLIGNEASFNGLPDGPHNSPHLPDGGHAGIVFMFGSSSHVLARENRCQGNHGAGIALVGDLSEGGPAWKAFHWVLEGNALIGNRRGIHVQHADWIVTSGNRFEGNTSGDIVTEGEVSRLVEQAAATPAATVAAAETFGAGDVRAAGMIDGPTTVCVGDMATYRVQLGGSSPESDQAVCWDAGDGTFHDGQIFTRIFDRAGVATVAANVSSGSVIDPLALSVFVTRSGREIGTEGDAAGWGLVDYHDRTRSGEQVSRAVFSDVESPRVVGQRAIAVDIAPYAGFRAALRFPAEGSLDLPLAGLKKLSFWLRAVNADTTGWQGGPFLMLHGADGGVCFLEPAAGRDLMRELALGEKADDWRLFSVPLAASPEAADARWHREGPLPERLAAISIAIDSWGAPPLQVWLDGLMLHEE